MKFWSGHDAARALYGLQGLSSDSAAAKKFFKLLPDMFALQVDLASAFLENKRGGGTSIGSSADRSSFSSNTGDARSGQFVDALDVRAEGTTVVGARNQLTPVEWDEVMPGKAQIASERPKYFQLPNKVPVSGREVAMMLYGLKGMSSDSDETRAILRSINVIARASLAHNSSVSTQNIGR